MKNRSSSNWQCQPDDLWCYTITYIKISWHHGHPWCVKYMSHSQAHLTAYPAQTCNYCIYLVSDLLHQKLRMHSGSTLFSVQTLGSKSRGTPLWKCSLDPGSYPHGVYKWRQLQICHFMFVNSLLQNLCIWKWSKFLLLAIQNSCLFLPPSPFYSSLSFKSPFL